jgi:DNA polymerase III sliding clamp (beta) subunit (PCNA family)
MKFECKGEVFIKAVQQVARARSKQQSQNYLQDIHFEIDNHLLTLRSTNLELFCEKSIPVKGLINGSCLLQGETLLRIISTFQSYDINLICELNDGVFSITTEKGVIEIKITPYEDFPTLPKQGTIIGTVSKETLNTLLKEVSFCAATTEIKPEIASVFIYTKDDFIYSVATDFIVERKIQNISGWIVHY